ncbi:MAG: hypothetical protein H0W04_09465 [Chthoniobacterales bacterium]|nr:hypothetical protein [Chthoniobacterales bacterium]
MKTTPTTYSLLVNSGEKGRAIFEGAIIGVIVLSTAFSFWQFASSSVVLPGMASTKSSQPTTMVAELAPQPTVVTDRS